MMNANELADELEEFSGGGAFKYYLEIAAVLRAQQEQIDNLKQWEKRYLDVIESLSQGSKAALDPALRTYDGKLDK